MAQRESERKLQVYEGSKLSGKKMKFYSLCLTKTSELGDTHFKRAKDLK